jgi:hypothetical protein
MPLADYQALVPTLVRDDSGKISNGDRDTAIDLACKRYGKDRPRILVKDVVSIGTNLLDLPAGWDVDSSAIVDLEYPIGEAPRLLIDQACWTLYQDPTSVKIQLTDAIAAGNSVRARFTVPHTLDNASDTIPAKDREAVACWAAAILCDQLASNFSGQSLATIAADSLDHGSRAKEFAARANALRNRYLNELGIDPKRDVPAGVTVQLQHTDTRGTRDNLTHPLRFFR